MLELFRWHVKFPDAKTLSRRADECRRLAKVCPEYPQKDFLKLAADYEQLAREAEIGQFEPPRASERRGDAVDELREHRDQWKLDEEVVPKDEVHSTPKRYSREG
jgi:hypothetical protein